MTIRLRHMAWILVVMGLGVSVAAHAAGKNPPATGFNASGSDDMAIVGGILGRADDMVVVRGVNVYPAAIEEVLRAAGGVAEYRVRVSEREGMHRRRALSTDSTPAIETFSIEAASDNTNDRSPIESDPGAPTS